jgi:hypothetical protein
MATPDPVEIRFWALLEDAWRACSKKVQAARAALITRDPDDETDTELIDEALEDIVEALETRFEEMPQSELAAMDRVLEQKLYDLDRAEIQEITDGSDDGFLYARGFIVALGKDYYDAVNASPEIAITDAECEAMCYLPAHVHARRFGAFPDHGGKISRESGSNTEGWPED